MGKGDRAKVRWFQRDEGGAEEAEELVVEYGY